MGFLREERGQSLSEYTLLIAFFLLSSCAMFLSHKPAMQGIWDTANTVLQWGAKLGKP
jgi:hypothetical protein